MSHEILGGLLVHFVNKYRNVATDKKPETVLEVPMVQLKSELLCDIEGCQLDTMLTGEIPRRQKPAPEQGYESHPTS